MYPNFMPHYSDLEPVVIPDLASTKCNQIADNLSPPYYDSIAHQSNQPQQQQLQHQYSYLPQQYSSAMPQIDQCRLLHLDSVKNLSSDYSEYIPMPSSSIRSTAVNMSNGASNPSVTTTAASHHRFPDSAPGSSNFPRPSTSAKGVSPSTSSSSSGSKSKQKSVYFNNVANIVCLFWFNEYSVLNSAFKAAQKSLTNLASIPSTQFSTLSSPTNSFKQFIMNVINHTQLPPTAVSLALLYVLKLKQKSPRSVVGNPNSEYRVFSVALMLANKFLDDNTYTNKTWADVTYLPLKEISAMEIEFLANMRYSLVVTEQEWQTWQRHLKVWLNIHSFAAASISGAVNGQPGAMPLSNMILPTTAASSTQQPSLAVPSRIAGLPSLNSLPVLANLPPSPFHNLPTPPLVPSLNNNSVASPYSLKRHLHTGSDNLENLSAAPPTKKMALNITPPHLTHSLSSLSSSSFDAQSNSTLLPLAASPYAPVYPVRTLLAKVQTPVTLMPVSQIQQLSPHHPSNIHQQAQPLPPTVYYILSKKNNPSPHYGFINGGQNFPSQQYQFELEHYRPHNPGYLTNHSSPLGPGHPVKFSSPTGVFSSSSWRANHGSTFSSPPSYQSGHDF